MRRLLALTSLLLASAAQGADLTATTGWSCTNSNGPGGGNVSFTVDSGSNRVGFFVALYENNTNPAMTFTSINNQTSDANWSYSNTTPTNDHYIYVHRFDESTLAAMNTDGIVGFSDAVPNATLAFCWGVIEDADNTSLPTAFLDTDVSASTSSHDSTTTNDTDDYVISIAVASESNNTFTWEWLTEGHDDSGGDGWRGGLAGGSSDGAAAKDVTTVSIANGPDDLSVVSFVVPNASATGPVLSGVTISAATNGYNLQGTLTGSGTLTAYGVACEPALSDPSVAQVVAGNCQDGTAALFSGSEVWTTGVQNDFDITDANSAVRYDVCLAGNDGTSDSTTVSCSEVSRSADTDQSQVELTSVASTSAWALQSENTCDTTNLSATISGCADTSWVIPGMLVDLSAGFADLTDVIVEDVTASTIVLENAANATSANITVTQDAYFNPTVAAGDWIEYDDSATCSAGSDSGVSIAADGEITYTATNCGSTYTTVDYCIQDDSSTAGVAFTTPDCWTTDDKLEFFAVRPDWDLDIDGGDQTIVLDQNVAMTSIDLTALCVDPQALTKDISQRSGTLPSGVSLTSGTLSGTPTVEDESGTAVVFSCFNTADLYSTTASFDFYVVDTWQMPTVTGGTLAAALTSILAAAPWRTEDDVTFSTGFACSTSVAVNNIITQVPAALAQVDDPYENFTVSVSLGETTPNCEPRAGGNKKAVIRGVTIGQRDEAANDSYYYAALGW